MKQTKKFLVAFALLFIASIASAQFSILPANLNNDTARCQHYFTKELSLSGALYAPSKYNWYAVGSLPKSISIDKYSGVLSGLIAYTNDTSVNFTVRVISTKAPIQADTITYTLEIRNTILTEEQLTYIWSQTNKPQRPDVYDTYFNIYNTLPYESGSGSSGWKITGNELNGTGYLGATNASSVSFITDSTERLRIDSTGYLHFFPVSGRINFYRSYGDRFLGLTNNSANIYLGLRAGNNSNGDEANIGIGTEALNSVDFNTLRNIGIGYQTLQTCASCTDNIAIGHAVGAQITSGNIENTIVGSLAASVLTSGQRNSIFGNGAGVSLMTGGNNSFFGRSAGSAITTGSYNTIIGRSAGGNVISGSNNTIIGAQVAAPSNVSSHVIIGDGTGQVRLQFDDTGALTLNGPAVSASVATASTNKIAIVVDGVTYYILVTTVP